MVAPTIVKDVLNPALYNNDDIEVQFYQQRKEWPWTRGAVHALGWVFFAGGLVLIFGLLNLRDILLDRRRLGYTLANNNKNKVLSSQRSLFDRMSLHFRAFCYLRSSVTGFATASLGLGSLVLAGFMYPLLYIFSQHPYYEREPRFGPPPLGGRSGMIALAMTPFIILLGMKANLISMVTGMGHEKLNVLHRWLGFVCGFFSLVHSAPYIIEPLKNGGWSKLAEVFNGHVTYWNGVGALVCMFWLTFGSLNFIRAWCYEVFVHLHIILGVGYVGLMFWHCANVLTSWHYLYATCIIWVSHLAYRFIWRTNWFGPRPFSGDQAHFTPLTDDGVKITVPTRMRWQAGQHIFIRIPNISLLDNHPFTVASIMSNDTKDGEYNDLVLVFKPHKGFTRRVFDISRTHPDVSYRAYLDGPYGGLSRKLEAFETVLMVAGGSGITPIVAHLQHLASKIQKGEALTRDIRIIWTVKRFESLEWFKDEISAAARSLPRNMLLCQYYVTEETAVELPKGPVSATREWPQSPLTPTFRQPPPALLRSPGTSEAEREFRLQILEKDVGSSSSDEELHEFPFPAAQPVTPVPPMGDEVLLEFGRPPLRDGLPPWSETFGRRTCIYVCGPQSMKVDVANAVADMQSDIWACEQREEIYLHSETFGW
ncbi:unnamed protein product [Tuber melanosporum]|uniref:ferric-chelate reductase (NADPH) n=1 Tax=Tuber melanosporum (strain Mel28) TaxID=656061 RepID=D5GBW3_TUBMM|nr:uncharacterized protein GSTUM_00005616001 [Tuber melanosporum]CAZ81963.1 unnamed protein product [Tuber melanosporum]